MRELRDQRIRERTGSSGRHGSEGSRPPATGDGDTIPNCLAKGISTPFLEAVGGNLYLCTASDKSVLGLTVTQLRDELSVYTKTQVDNMLDGKADAEQTHGISLCKGTAGDSPHEHLVQATTGIEQ